MYKGSSSKSEMAQILQSQHVSNIFNLPSISRRCPRKEWLDSTCNFLAGLTGEHRSEVRPVKRDSYMSRPMQDYERKTRAWLDTPECAMEGHGAGKELQSAHQSSGVLSPQGQMLRVAFLSSSTSVQCDVDRDC